MPIRVTSFYLPASASIPYILEDVYIRGGMRSVSTEADRDAIPAMARKVGMIVYCVDKDKYYRLDSDRQTWSILSLGGGSGGSGGSGGTRYTETFASATIAAGASVNLDMTLKSPTVMLLDLTIDIPDVKIQVFSKADRTDANPYTFITSATMRTDEGLTLEDGTASRVRKYAFWANADDGKIHRSTLTNLGIASVVANLTVTYLTME